MPACPQVSVHAMLPHPQDAHEPAPQARHSQPVPDMRAVYALRSSQDQSHGPRPSLPSAALLLLPDMHVHTAIPRPGGAAVGVLTEVHPSTTHKQRPASQEKEQLLHLQRAGATTHHRAGGPPVRKDRAFPLLPATHAPTRGADNMRERSTARGLLPGLSPVKQ
jgi:hypothetical protein